MNPDIKQKWVEALRSGRYRQAKQVLRISSDRYCCLGVLTDIYLKEHNKDWEIGTGGYSCDDVQATLPTDVMRWAGLRESIPSIREVGRTLAQLNDNGCNFDEIARLIDKYL